MKSLQIMVAAHRCLCVVAALLAAQAVQAADAPPRVALDLTTERDFPITGAQEWTKLLGDLGISNVRIHSGGSAEIKVDETKPSRGGRSFRVFGVLHANGSLEVPGGNFKTSDRAAIKQWLAKLGADGREALVVEQGPFGLLPSHLEKINDDLQQVVSTTTKDEAALDVVRTIGKQLKYPLRFERGAEAVLKAARLGDDLQGLSAGAALAAACRAGGLTIAPGREAQGGLQYAIARGQRGKPGWPIGRDVGSQAPRVLPGLFDEAAVEISETPLVDVLAAVSAQLETKLLVDRYALADQQIALGELVANLPAKRTTYGLVLRRVLGKARLTYELRVDERGRPFLWVTTSKPVE